MALVRFYSASVNKLHNVLQTGIYSHAPMKPNPSPGGRNFILTSLFLGLTFRPVFSHVFPGRFSPVDLSRDQCCRPVRQGRVMRFCGVREREREREGHSVVRQQQVQLWQSPCCCSPHTVVEMRFTDVATQCSGLLAAWDNASLSGSTPPKAILV